MKKKMVGILMCLVMLLSLLISSSTVALADITDYSYIRVLLSIGNPTSLSFYADGNYSINGSGDTITRQLYTAKVESGVINIYYGSTVVAGGATSITLTQHAATDGLNNFIWLNNAEHGYCRYLGDLTFSTNGTTLTLINRVHLEQYLWGVVGNEMSNGFPLEALKAQAVAARVYAANHKKGGTKDLFDLVDTSSDQVYKGYDPNDTKVIQAVTETSGKILKCGSENVQFFYGATNGGWVDIPQHRWSGTNTVMPYHIMKSDPYDLANPSSPQEVLVFPRTITAKNPIQYKIREKGNMITNGNSSTAATNASIYLRLCALPVVAAKGYIANVSGDIEIVGVSKIVPHTLQTGTSSDPNKPGYDGVNLNADYLKADVTMNVLANRYATPEEGDGYLLGDVDMNGSISVSDYTLVRLHILGIKPLTGDSFTIADTDRNGSISISDYTNIRLHILELKPITARTDNGLVQEQTTVKFTINMTKFDSVTSPYRSFFNSSLELFCVEQDEANWYIYHRRYGHGIGMSQRGAQQQANEGRSYVDILTFYYPNTTFADLPMTPLSDFTLPAATSIAYLNANATIDNCTDSVNIRSGAGTTNPVIGKLPKGTRIKLKSTVLASDGYWYGFNYGGNVGYVSASYVAIL